MDDIEAKFPTKYEESLNTVFTQETFKYTRLLKKLKATLPMLRKALKGLVVMSQDLEDVGNAFLSNHVPGAWNEYLSLMPLSSWIENLKKRCAFLSSWVKKGQPESFWVSGFIFPQAFFTAALQNHARYERIAIDLLSFGFQILDHLKSDASDLPTKPSEGVVGHGLYLEGCRWDAQQHALGPSQPKVLYWELPPLHFMPEANREAGPPGTYRCPVYKVLSRKGTLSTTGHSTNFVLYIDLQTNVDADDWIRAGVAAFLALRY